MPLTVATGPIGHPHKSPLSSAEQTTLRPCSSPLPALSCRQVCTQPSPSTQPAKTRVLCVSSLPPPLWGWKGGTPTARR
jgi:hypothetical protein